MSRSPHPSEHGQAVVEFALAIPIICMLLFAVGQYGLMIWSQMDLTSATRDGARRAAVARKETNPATIVRNVTLSSLDQTAQSAVTVTVTGGWNQSDVVTVRATMPYSLDILGKVVWSGNLKSESQVRIG